MATPTAVEKPKAALPAQVTTLMRSLVPSLPALLPPDISMDQFRAALYLELTGRPDLYDCTPESLRECVVKAATYGLVPGRDCHFLPFRNRRGGNRLATFVPNYMGLILALERSGKVAKAFAHPVYAGDEFAIDYLADIYRHVPAVARGKAPGSLRFFYGCVRLKDGTTHIEIMDESQIDAVKRRSPAHEHGPWIEDFEMMARKTALKRAMKYVRLTPQVQEMLLDDAEREQEDIPQERHQQNIIDLFGEPVNPTAYTTQTPSAAPTAVHVDSVTGEVLRDDDPGQTSLLAEDEETETL